MLILAALFLTVAVTLAGVGFDLSRVMLVRASLLHDAEAAAVAAALSLDGSMAGLARARTAAADFAADTEVRFGAAPAGPWIAEPPNANELKFVRVQLARDPRLSMARTVAGQGSLHVKVRAVAGQFEVTSWDSGLSPFALAVGASPPLGWAEDPSPEAARAAVLDGLQSSGRRVGAPAAPLGPVPSDALLALRDRVTSDTDRESASYSDYAARGQGNGRRLIPVQLIDAGGKLAGTAAWFVRMDASAERAGGYLQAGKFRAVADSGYWTVRLVNEETP